MFKQQITKAHFVVIGTPPQLREYFFSQIEKWPNKELLATGPLANFSMYPTGAFMKATVGDLVQVEKHYDHVTGTYSLMTEAASVDSLKKIVPVEATHYMTCKEIVPHGEKFKDLNLLVV